MRVGKSTAVVSAVVATFQQRFVHGGVSKGSIQRKSILAEQRKSTHGRPIANPERVESVAGSKDGQMHRQRTNRFTLGDEETVPRYSWGFTVGQLETFTADMKLLEDDMGVRGDSRLWNDAANGKVLEGGGGGGSGRGAERVLLERMVRFELSNMLPILEETVEKASVSDISRFCETISACNVPLLQGGGSAEGSSVDALIGERLAALTAAMVCQLEKLMVEEQATTLLEGGNLSPLRLSRLEAKQERQVAKVKECFEKNGIDASRLEQLLLEGRDTSSSGSMVVEGGQQQQSLLAKQLNLLPVGQEQQPKIASGEDAAAAATA